MILKIRTNNGFVYVDNMYMVEIRKVDKASFRGTKDGDNAMWIENIDKTTSTCTPNKTGYCISAQKYMYEHECRTVKLTSYIIDSGYLLNDNGKTVEAIISRD